MKDVRAKFFSRTAQFSLYSYLIFAYQFKHSLRYERAIAEGFPEKRNAPSKMSATGMAETVIRNGLISKGSQLLEREAALEALKASLDRLADGIGSVIVVSGEAGIGKTALIRSFLSDIEARTDILQGGCEDLSMPRLLGPLFDMAEVLDPEILDILADEKHHNQLLTAFPIMLRTRTLPVMIVEDIHWADDATLDLLKFLGRRAKDLPVLIILTHRDDEPGNAFSVGRVLGSFNPKDLSRITLSPFSRGAIATLAKDSGHNVSEILAITAGNPFFVTEILANGENGNGALPLSVRDAVWSRIERCSAHERSVLEVLSILPGGSTRDLLMHLCAQSGGDEVDRLIEKGMLVADGHIVRFRHELARQATLELVQSGKRKALHLAAADWLAQSPKGDELPVLVQRIHHANAAEDSAAIAKLTPIAASRAAAAGAHRQAAHLLALALPYASEMPDEEAAQLFESWSHESGLAEQIDESALEARRNAIKLWSALGRTDKVGHNLLWLSRYLWYLGQGDESEAIGAQALEVLESCELGASLAWSYSFRSQVAMLNDRFVESIESGEKAIELAKQLGEHEVLIHALNSVGSSMMLSGQVDRGRALLLESLDLADRDGEHIHAARAYTNLAENSLAVGDLKSAYGFLEQGIVFDTEHELDSWLHYLRGCKARYLMMVGSFDEATALARDVFSLPNQTLVMRLPSLTVLVHLGVRTGAHVSDESLESVHAHALGTKEPQRIAPIRIAMCEAMWLSGDYEAVRQIVDETFAAGYAVQKWHAGELCSWAHRAGFPVSPLPNGIPEPMSLECSGSAELAAECFANIGLPFEQALALSGVQGENRGQALSRAISILESINATQAVDRIRLIADLENLAIPTPKRKRGQYNAARAHPLGLTQKEQKILQFLSEGASNAMIAAQLSRSVRTIEHHVSSVLSKLNVGSRSEVASIVSQNPNLLNYRQTPPAA